MRRSPFLRFAVNATLGVTLCCTGCDDDDSPHGDAGQVSDLDGGAGGDGHDASVPEDARDAGAEDDGSVCFGEACNDPSAFRPEPVPPTPALVAQLRVPQVWRDGLSDPSRDGEADPGEDGQADPTGDGQTDPVSRR